MAAGGGVGWFLQVPFVNLSRICRGSCYSKSREGNRIRADPFQECNGFICLKELVPRKPRWRTRSHTGGSSLGTGAPR